MFLANPSASRVNARGLDPLRALARSLGLAVALLAGCDGAILAPDGDGAGGPGEGAADTPAPTSRFPRLTHGQWERSVRDLFRLDADAPTFSTGFRADPSLSGFVFDEDGGRLSVDETLWVAYQRAAAELAAHVTGDPARLARILPPDGGDEAARARAFVQSMGRRAWRRPLAPDEVDALVAVYEAGRTRYPGVAPFTAGVRLVIEALVQAPAFVYRVERSDRVEGGAIPLDGFEVATRLSYALWGTTPDDALLDRAASGALTRPEVVREEALRLLSDPRATDTVTRFHGQLLDVGGFDGIRPSSAAFPDVPEDLGRRAATAQDLFVRALYEEGASWSDLLTSSEAFVDAELARLYGLDGEFGDAFVRVALDPARRRGLFTQIGFLARNATSTDPDPIHRGVFLSKRIACNPLGAPPDDIPPLPAPMGRTNREVVEDHTEQPGSACARCHEAAINPFGFAFEHYDAVGAWRDTDAGYPVDAAAEPLLGGQRVVVEDGVALAGALAASDAVHRCYAEHLLEFLHARPKASADAPLVDRVAAMSLDGASIRALILELVTSRAFLTRALPEDAR